jgi:c-di-GMP-binding flagellar brake protein YcgR
MVNQRRFTRKKCKSECAIINHLGRIYHAFLEDISIGGALIMVRDGIPRSLLDGDEYRFMLPNDIYLIKSFRVVRHDSANMGIQFLTNKDQ